MRWKGRRESENVEDRRGVSPGGMAAGGGGLLLIVLIVSCLLGVDPRPLLQQMGPALQQQTTQEDNPQHDEWKKLVAVVLADTEDVWTEVFRQEGLSYRKPTLVLFSGSVRSACGFQSAATGPFYCPPDEHVYIDLEFFDQMRQRMNAPGDFAQAYVIAHEVGHHVQKLLGISDRVDALRRQVSTDEANQLSVRLELHADFLAGVWAHHAQQEWDILEQGDVEEALNAAAQIGDDHLQKQSQGYVVPESFTHGTSEQRVRWFFRGLKSGDLNEGDTFGVRYDDL
jgi:predicted metalloprotease